MAEETTVTPTAEEIAAAAAKPPEGSIAAIDAAPAAPKAEETVPLSVYLALKEDVKDLKKAAKEAKPQTKAEERATVKALSAKYPDVNANFIEDIVGAAVQETEAKYEPIIQRQEADRKQADFDKAFTTIFDKALAENPDAKNVDKEVVKALALTPQYNNTPVAELIQKLYGGAVGRATTENDMRASADVVDEIVDIDKITPEQREKIMDNPKARAAYFAALDKAGR